MEQEERVKATRIVVARHRVPGEQRVAAGDSNARTALQLAILEKRC